MRKPKSEEKDGRSSVQAAEDFEVRHLAELTGISEEQARILVRRYGTDRQRLIAEAKNFRGK